MTSRKNVIRTIYLYLFAATGITLSVIGCVMITNIVFKTFVFKNANSVGYNYYYNEPMYYSEDLTATKALVETLQSKDKSLTDDQQKTLDAWLEDYQEWSDAEAKRKEYYNSESYKNQSRDEDLSIAFSMLIIGIPLYLIHWFTIVSDIKKEKDREI